MGFALFIFMVYVKQLKLASGCVYGKVSATESSVDCFAKRTNNLLNSSSFTY